MYTHRYTDEEIERECSLLNACSLVTIVRQLQDELKFQVMRAESAEALVAVASDEQRDACASRGCMWCSNGCPSRD